MWLSILNTQASPSPMSTTPAFSPGPLDDMRRRGRQAAQVQARRLVGTMLVPHGRHDADLGPGRVTAADQGDEARVFVGLDAVRRDDVGRDRGGPGAPRVRSPSDAGARVTAERPPKQGGGRSRAPTTTLHMEGPISAVPRWMPVRRPRRSGDACPDRCPSPWCDFELRTWEAFIEDTHEWPHVQYSTFAAGRCLARRPVNSARISLIVPAG